MSGRKLRSVIAGIPLWASAFEAGADVERRAGGEVVHVEVAPGVARRRLWWPLDDNYIGRLGFAEAEVIKVPPAIAGGTLNVRQAGH